MEVFNHSVRQNTPINHDSLREKADAIEVHFLKEVMKVMGVADQPEFLGGSFGEQHFSSFLIEEYSQATMRSGGIGLSESIYQALLKVDNDE